MLLLLEKLRENHEQVKQVKSKKAKGKRLKKQEYRIQETGDFEID